MHEFVPIKLIEVITKEVGVPRNDGTEGSALYKVPIRISAVPPPRWVQIFGETWRRPPHCGNILMHRSGIASVSGDRIILDGTTIEELEKHHRKTLMSVVEEANRLYVEYEKTQKEGAERDAARTRQHLADVAEKAKRIRFDER